MLAIASPGSLVTLAGAALSVIGWVGYATSNPNLSLPTIFYGIPILLGGLALKSSELPPAELLPAQADAVALREEASSKTLRKLVKDVTRWRYGQKAHLESSLEALKLWDEDNPPQLEEIEELCLGNNYGLRLRFSCEGVPLERWHDRQERLSRFFAKGLEASITPLDGDRLDLTLLPAGVSAKSEHGKTDAQSHG